MGRVWAAGPILPVLEQLLGLGSCWCLGPWPCWNSREEILAEPGAAWLGTQRCPSQGQSVPWAAQSLPGACWDPVLGDSALSAAHPVWCWNKPWALPVGSWREGTEGLAQGHGCLLGKNWVLFTFWGKTPVNGEHGAPRGAEHPLPWWGQRQDSATV